MWYFISSTTGCQLRFLPKDFPCYKTAYSFYKRARNKAIWEHMRRDLLAKNRIKMGRNPNPSCCSTIDLQSVKTTGAAVDRGIDGGKKIKGRKHHIVTDINGHLLCLKVHAANMHDTVAVCTVFQNTLHTYPTLQGVSADTGYRKTMEHFVTSILKKTIEISQRITSGWAVLAKRWVVERTFAWFNVFRRLKIMQSLLNPLKPLLSLPIL